MATKSIHNETNFKSDQVARRLDTLVDSVSKRGVYVIDRNDRGTYNIVDYISTVSVVENLPTRESAEKLCERYNKGIFLSRSVKKDVEMIINNYDRLSMDVLFYTQTVNNSSCNATAEIAEMRRSFALAQMKKNREDILKLI